MDARFGMRRHMLGSEFKSEYLDFRKGIRVGHLEPRARITQILKLSLQQLYGQDFIIDRWGRGVYWQWICFLPRANRRAKPISGGRNFSSAKFFIMVDREEEIFKSGLHLERGLIRAPDAQEDYQLRPDWDWHRLMRGLEPDGWWEQEVRRLIEEDGFQVTLGSFRTGLRSFSRHLPPASDLREIVATAPPDKWFVFQLHYPMTPEEVGVSEGPDLVAGMMAVFRELTPVMNLCLEESAGLRAGPAT